jgi:hypothetical protein
MPASAQHLIKWFFVKGKAKHHEKSVQAKQTRLSMFFLVRTTKSIVLKTPVKEKCEISVIHVIQKRVVVDWQFLDMDIA